MQERMSIQLGSKQMGTTTLILSLVFVVTSQQGSTFSQEGSYVRFVMDK